MTTEPISHENATGAQADYLQFQRDENGGLVHRVGWRGPWPPPARMGLAVGNRSKIVKVFEPLGAEDGTPAAVSEEIERELIEHPTIDVTFYRRHTFSRMPPQGPGSHVARGALYIPEED